MSEAVSTGAPPSRADIHLERVKTGATILGAIAAAITGLWGVYEKVRSEARQDTAASYNTLAPQVNQMGEALKEMQLENQQLRQIVAQFQGRPRIATVPKRTTASAAKGPAAATGKSADKGESGKGPAEAGQNPAAAPVPVNGAGAPPAGTTANGGAAPAGATPADGAAAPNGAASTSTGTAAGAPGVTPNGSAAPGAGAIAEPPAAPGTSPNGGASDNPDDPDDPITGLINTVGRTRDAIESIRKVPDDFGRVLLEKKQGQNGRTPPPPSR